MGGGPSCQKGGQVSRTDFGTEEGKSEQQLKPELVSSTPNFEDHKEAVGGERPPQQLVLPHDFDAIVKDADCSVDVSSADSLYQQLHTGVYLNQSKKKYWTDEKSNNCFMLFARSLSIAWSENRHYWHWSAIKDTIEISVDTAELLNVCWLEVCGRVETARLTPGVTYTVGFEVMVKDPAYGWETPVDLRLKLPCGKVQEHKESLLGMSRGRWVEICVGEFCNHHQDPSGVVELSLCEHESALWKRGLVIKGAFVRPLLQHDVVV